MSPSPTSQTADAYWSEVSAHRIELADQVDTLDPPAWDAASWCAGWRVRDVLGHLVFLAEATQASMATGLIRHGMRPHVMLNRQARAIGSLPVPVLTDRLRAAASSRFHIAGLPRAVVLGEVAAHGSDMLRPIGADVTVSAPSLIPALDLYGRIGRLAFGRALARRVAIRLVATDCEWAHGTGEEVRGRAVDLLLLMANRQQVIPALSGPGVSLLGG